MVRSSCYVLQIKQSVLPKLPASQRSFRKVVKASCVLTAREGAAASAAMMSPFDDPELWLKSKFSVCKNIDAPVVSNGLICEEFI